MRHAAVVLLLVTLCCAPAAADERQACVPGYEGKLFSTRRIAESRVVKSLNAALGDGCNVSLADNGLLVRFNPQKLPRNSAAIRQAARVFTATVSPDATAAQQRSYGLLLPPRVEPDRRMIVLIHGLDCSKSNWFPMADLLVGEGYQVAYFTYPSDGPLEESAAMLARQMGALRESFPEVQTSILAHSMGGLVARRYVECDDLYAGGVDHLIMLGTPNLGTRWAGYRWVLECQEHYRLWKSDRDWCFSWMITDGLGEAGRDLKPESRFLQQLNARPRRAGVKYTVIAGSQHPIYGIGANALDGTANVIPDRAAKWWGFRQAESTLHRGAAKLRRHAGSTDGPVSVKRTPLPGAEDYVLLPTDHAGLYYPVNGDKPAAWEVVRDRLSR